AATTGLVRRRPRGLFFAACLAEGAMPRYNQLSGWFVSPISRLADRVSDFSMQFVRTLSDGVPVLDAWRSAGIADQAANDIRRFLFQLQAGWM
ncbi:MAG: hypothetical protein KDK27_17015, partial [Leptospiraceae bacterium]|nr:hypothetical protein [Leptospiraceae bacterium]